MFIVFTLVQLITFVLADVCNHDAILNVGKFQVQANAWGSEEGTGWQCMNVDVWDDTKLAWHVEYDWQGVKYRVKAFPSVVEYLDSPISSIHSIETHWDYEYGGHDIAANVAYDIITTLGPGKRDFEIMIWAAMKGRIGPLKETYNDGKPALAYVTINKINYALWHGLNTENTENGQYHTYTFVPEKEGIAKGIFEADLKIFVDYLVKLGLIPSFQRVTEITAGSEIFLGKSAQFTTHSYSLTIA